MWAGKAREWYVNSRSSPTAVPVELRNPSLAMICTTGSATLAGVKPYCSGGSPKPELSDGRTGFASSK
jgi:hypothetical protein